MPTTSAVPRKQTRLQRLGLTPQDLPYQSKADLAATFGMHISSMKRVFMTPGCPRPNALGKTNVEAMRRHIEKLTPAVMRAVRDQQEPHRKLKRHGSTDSTSAPSPMNGKRGKANPPVNTPHPKPVKGKRSVREAVTSG